MNKRRVMFISIFFIGLIFILIGRFAQIQLIETESFSKHNINLLEKSVEQRSQSWTIDSGRGRFIDKHGNPLTHDVYPTLVLFPFLKGTNWPKDKIAEILNENVSDLEKALEGKEKPFIYHKDRPLKLTINQMDQINELKIPGVFAIHQQVEINSLFSSHLIGITRENEELLLDRYPEKVERGTIPRNAKIGITGLQQSFDEFLLPEGEAKLLYHVDNRGEPLFGLNVKYAEPANPYYPAAIKTTLDRDLQKISEDVVEKHKLKKGGIILLDVETSDIVAMVSRPRMNAANPFGDEGGINHMIVPQNPGSIFKLVSAAAAIEKNAKIRGRTFNCNQNLYGDGEANRKLGKLNFEESFAQSCNFTFATLTQEMMEEENNILNIYANKLGLLEEVSWTGDVFHFQEFTQIPGESKGKIWGDERDKGSKKAIAQTAIGQKNVRISPLAAVNAMATIARGGEKRSVKAVSAIEYKNGTTLYQFNEKVLDGERLSSYAATKLQDLLRKVVTDGTGRRLASLPYQVAGKSGTAQTGKDGLIHKWFVGYFPIENPKYALVAVDLHQIEGKTKSLSVFHDIVEEIHNYENNH